MRSLKQCKEAWVLVPWQDGIESGSWALLGVNPHLKGMVKTGVCFSSRREQLRVNCGTEEAASGVSEGVVAADEGEQCGLSGWWTNAEKAIMFLLAKRM